MARPLERKDVLIVLMDVLNSMEHYGLEDKDAEHHASYTAGVLDMTNAVIKAIGELGGK